MSEKFMIQNDTCTINQMSICTEIVRNWIDRSIMENCESSGVKRAINVYMKSC